ncbi:patatin-like phospholipase family protein [Parashewanella tropica]|uniref:patatin-like phospholipase family protein n=1 Tax=Parashewanella tropica TaxID=2547970 RepID=UPI001478F8A0|nr:patatin-like phospholipase family protein [Parashewanella tropica]
MAALSATLSRIPNRLAPATATVFTKPKFKYAKNEYQVRSQHSPQLPFHLEQNSDRKEAEDVRSSNQNADTTKPFRFDSLVLSGGGAKGAGYAGLIEELDTTKRLESINDLVGTSIGGMVLFALSLGASINTTQQWMASSGAKFDKEIMNTQLETILWHVCEPHLQFISEYLKFKGEPLLDDSGQRYHGENGRRCIANINFRQHQLLVDACTNTADTSLLPQNMKSLTIIASILGKYEIEFSAENTPSVPIVTAAIASSSMPKLMPPVELPSSAFKCLPPVRIPKTLKLFDGGLTNNTPHIYAKGLNKLVVTPYSPKVLLPDQQQSSLDVIAEELKLAASSLVLGFNASRVMRLNRFDIRQATVDPSVTLFFLKVNVGVQDFQRGLIKFWELSNDSRLQTHEFLKQRQAFNSSSDSKTQTKEQQLQSQRKYTNEKYSFASKEVWR